MFELSQLRCFIAVAEEMHFGRAAARMNMTQPPLSRQIQLLERLLGVTLLERSSRVVRLTPAGKAFLVDARKIIRMADSAALNSRRAARGEAGALALGFTAASSYRFVPRMMDRIRAELPEIDLSLKEMVSSDQLDALLSRDIDLGLIRPPLGNVELEAVTVLREGLLIAAPTSEIAGHGTPTCLADFDGMPMVIFSPNGARYFFDLLTGLFADAGITPRYVQYVSQIHSILALVGAGLGAALVPEAASALHFEGVTFTPLKEADRHVELLLAWRRDNDNPALSRAIACMTEG